jgi:O-antigen/teichoic acid export membrane protein
VSAEDLGVYVVLFNLSRLIAVLAAVINIVVFPKMAGRPIEEMRSLHDHVVRIVFYVIVGLTVLTVIFGSKFVAMVYGPGYNMSGNLLVILVLECGVSCMCQVSTQFYLAAGKPIPASVIQALSLAVVYCALSVLVGTAGIIGAAWALLIAGTAKLLMLLVGIRFYYDSLPRLYPKISDIVYIRDLLR